MFKLIVFVFVGDGLFLFMIFVRYMIYEMSFIMCVFILYCIRVDSDELS